MGTRVPVVAGYRAFSAFILLRNAEKRRPRFFPPSSSPPPSRRAYARVSFFPFFSFVFFHFSRFFFLFFCFFFILVFVFPFSFFFVYLRAFGDARARARLFFFFSRPACPSRKNSTLRKYRVSRQLRIAEKSSCTFGNGRPAKCAATKYVGLTCDGKIPPNVRASVVRARSNERKREREREREEKKEILKIHRFYL